MTSKSENRQKPNNLTFNLSGATCYNCVKSIKKRLWESEFSDYIEDINIDPSFKNLHIRLSTDEYNLSAEKLNNLFSGTKYKVSEIKLLGWWRQYQSIVYIFLISTLAEIMIGEYFYHKFQAFMAFWLILFAMPKLADLKGFVTMFRKYDVLGKKSTTYAYLYPFVELILGIIHLFRGMDDRINYGVIAIATFTFISVVGVILKKEKIACACLGSGSKMQVGWVTLLENLIMIMLSMFMLYSIG